MSRIQPLSKKGRRREQLKRIDNNREKIETAKRKVKGGKQVGRRTRRTQNDRVIVIKNNRIYSPGRSPFIQ